MKSVVKCVQRVQNECTESVQKVYNECAGKECIGKGKEKWREKCRETQCAFGFTIIAMVLLLTVLLFYCCSTAVLLMFY